MEWDEIPERWRHYLVEQDECWVPAARHRVKQPRPLVGQERASLRQVLWCESGREPANGRRLTPQCGCTDCHRPEHQRPSNLTPHSKAEGNRRLSRRYHSRMRRMQFVERLELERVVRAMERRGFVRFAGNSGLLPVMTYRVGLGKGRSSRASRAHGPWWLYWQEPPRPAASKAAQRKVAA